MVLTVPLLPMDMWPSCCASGPIIEVGWMDMVWSMPGVNTAPYGEMHKEGDVTSARQTDENNHTLLLPFNYI